MIWMLGPLPPLAPQQSELQSFGLPSTHCSSRIMVPKDGHILIPRNCDYVTVIKLRIKSR